MEVFVVYGDNILDVGQSGSAVDRTILAVCDSVEKARDLVRKFEKKSYYEYVDFEMFEVQ